jgi:hypothetical protein
MGRTAMFLAVVVGVLIASVLPDYIGLGLGFRSFLDHEDLTRREVVQFGWLAGYCVAMSMLLVGLAVALLLRFTHAAGRTRWVGAITAVMTVALACVHLGLLYLESDAIAPRTKELFVASAERHAWTVFLAALLALVVLYPRKVPDFGSSGAAPTRPPG